MTYFCNKDVPEKIQKNKDNEKRTENRASKKCFPVLEGSTRPSSLPSAAFGAPSKNKLFVPFFRRPKSDLDSQPPFARNFVVL